MRRIDLRDEPLETVEQRNLVRYTRLHVGAYPCLRLLYAVPNGGFRNKTTAAHLKEEGVIPGVPDLVLPVARGGYFGWYGEMKRLRQGSLTPEQSAFLLSLRAGGYWASWHRGADEMWRDLMFYLALPPTPHVGMADWPKHCRMVKEEG